MERIPPLEKKVKFSNVVPNVQTSDVGKNNASFTTKKSPFHAKVKKVGRIKKKRS